MSTETIETWLAGWAISRRVPDPVRTPYGFVIDVGTPRELTRHLLTEASDSTINAVAATINDPTTTMKFPRAPHEIRHHFGTEWTVHDPQHLMRAQLKPLPSNKLPPGYRMSTSPEDRALQVAVHAPDATLAARGRCALAGNTAVIDQVRTDDAHQRRGLGTTVMNALTAYAMDHGCRSAVLLATETGRALYESVGWTVVLPFTAASYIGRHD